MVIGDGLMMYLCSMAGLAVAWRAVEVKSHAHALTASNDEDGVAKAIEEHILAK